MKRESGILLHISSLPSPYGIGTLGEEAFRFVDFLTAAGQRYWQILPIGPTGFGDSPYQTVSIHAGNPYFIDLDLLIRDGLLCREDLEGLSWGEPGRVDYGLLYRERAGLLRRACERGRQRQAEPFAAFRRENPWVEDYALFMALKARYEMRPWSQWDSALAEREPEALAQAREELREEIACIAFAQYLFDAQWRRLRAYAQERGLCIVGDLPIYVPMDCVEVWLQPELFQLDAARRPLAVAGCPPDGFNEDGQLWGNPLYDWERHAQSGFVWWQERVRAAARRFDLVRLDHFRGLESYWSVPYGEATARNGRWVKGPGMKLIEALRRGVPEAAFIAEDLGYLTPEVRALLAESGLPGMKVLEFAFYGDNSAYLPHNHVENAVCYTGTHDNQTLAQWLAEESEETIARARDYLGLNEAEGFVRGMIRGGMSSVARIFIAQMQDWLRLGGEARMNVPGELSPENWSWRLREQPDAALAAEIFEMTKRYARTGETRNV